MESKPVDIAPLNPLRHAGKVALVTGASKGIGRAIAMRLAREGAEVALSYLTDPDGAGQAVEEISRRGGTAVALRADLGSPRDCDDLVASCVDQFGRLDILVNNAAIFPWSNWEEVSLEEWDQVFAVNVRGAFLTARASLAGMRSRGWGRMVFMSSGTYLTGSTALMHYSASKGAIVGLVRSLARALGDDGITVNAVTTGRTLTEGIEALFEIGATSYEESVASRQSQSIKRLAEPGDIVGTVAFLASEESAYMTGQLLNVDGGRNMH